MRYFWLTGSQYGPHDDMGKASFFFSALVHSQFYEFPRTLSKTSAISVNGMSQYSLHWQLWWRQSCKLSLFIYGVYISIRDFVLLTLCSSVKKKISQLSLNWSLCVPNATPVHFTLQIIVVRTRTLPNALPRFTGYQTCQVTSAMVKQSFTVTHFFSSSS